MNVTNDQWEKMDEAEQLSAIREGRLSRDKIGEVASTGSEAVRRAAADHLEDRANQPRSGESIFEQLRGRPLSEPFGEKLAQLGRPSATQLSDMVKPGLDLPEVQIPRYRIPTQAEAHDYESARTLIARLQARYALWEKELGEAAQPAIYAILSNGMVMKADSFGEDGHNGIAIYGELEGMPRCLIITHQAGLQLLCVAEVLEPKSARRVIGFYTQEGSSEAPKRS